MYINGKKKGLNNLKISKFRVVVIIYRAFFLEADVPGIGLNRFNLSFIRERVFKPFDSVW